MIQTPMITTPMITTAMIIKNLDTDVDDNPTQNLPPPNTRETRRLRLGLQKANRWYVKLKKR